jgi:hypothetical protein
VGNKRRKIKKNGASGDYVMPNFFSFFFFVGEELPRNSF